MGKTLKYVKDFEFPSDKGYSASSGQTMVKGYARGGSCGMAKGGMKPMKKADGGAVDDPRRPLMERTLREYIDAINAERAMEMVDRQMSNAERAAMERAATRRSISQGLRSPMAEMARERALLGENAGYKKGGMAKGGKMDRLKGVIGNERSEMARVEAKQRDAGQELSRVRSEMRYDKNEMKGMRKQYPTNRSEPMIAMKKGGHVSKKIMKKFDGGYIQDPAASGVPQAVSPLTQIANPQAQPTLQNMIPPGNTSLSPTAMKRGGKVGAKLVKMADGGAMVIRDPSYSPNNTPRVQQQPSTNMPRIQQQPSTNMPRQPNPYTVDARPVTQGPGTGTPAGRPVGGGRPANPYTVDARPVTQGPGTGTPAGRPVGGGRPLAPGATPRPQMGQMTAQQASANAPRFANQAAYDQYMQQATGGRQPTMQPQTQPRSPTTLPPQQMGRPAMAKGGMLYSKKEVTAKNLLGEGKAPPLPHAKGSVNMAKGGMTSKQQAKVGKVMGEFKAGDLHSGKNGPVVKSRKQAIAIGLSEARRAKK